MSMREAYTLLHELEGIYFQLYLHKCTLTKSEGVTIPARPRCKTLSEIHEQIEYQIKWIKTLEEEILHYRKGSGGYRPGRVARERDKATFLAITELVTEFKTKRVTNAS